MDWPIPGYDNEVPLFSSIGAGGCVPKLLPWSLRASTSMDAGLSVIGAPALPRLAALVALCGLTSALASASAAAVVVVADVSTVADSAAAVSVAAVSVAAVSAGAVSVIVVSAVVAVATVAALETEEAEVVAADCASLLPLPGPSCERLIAKGPADINSDCTLYAGFSLAPDT